MIVAAAAASAAAADARIDADPGVILASIDRLLDGFLAMLPLLVAALASLKPNRFLRTPPIFGPRERDGQASLSEMRLGRRA